MLTDKVEHRIMDGRAATPRGWPSLGMGSAE